MASNGNFQGLFESLKRNPLSRTTKDILNISSIIHEYFESVNLETTKYLSSFAYYVSFEKDVILFNVQDKADCWFILLTGKVLLKGKIYTAPCSFGKIYDGQITRTYQCRSVEYSQLMKIFYPSSGRVDPLEQNKGRGGFEEACNNNNNNNNNNNKLSNNDSSDDNDDDDDDDDDDDADEDTFQESFLDFDFSDLASESFTAITVKDVVQECLEKNPNERKNEDVKILRDFMLHFNNQVFNSFQKEVQDLICRKLTYVVVEKEGAMVMSEGEELKYWAFVINGCLEVIHPTNESYNRLIHMGDIFGADPCNDSPTKSQFNIVTRVPSCHYISLSKEDWASIINKEGKSVEKETIEDGKKVLVVEEREVRKGGRKGCFVKKGTSEQLIKFLVDVRSTEDPMYVEDFLLTSRIFLNEGMTNLTDHLMLWFNSAGRLRDKSVRIVLLWVNNHFEDFEADFVLSRFLMSFMLSMQTNGMSGQLELLHRACCAQAKMRRVTIERPTVSQPWTFNFILGKEPGKVFIDTTTFVTSNLQVENDSPALLIKGDQIMEINEKNALTMSNKSIIDLINKATKLELQVKCNFVEHSEALTKTQRSRTIFPKQSCSQEESEKTKRKNEWSTKRLFSNVIEPFIRKINLFGQTSPSSSMSPSNSRQLVTGSNPDLSIINSPKQAMVMSSSPPGEVQVGSQDALHVYLLGQSKPILLSVNRTQNALQVTKVALKSSGLCGDASGFSLYEVTFKDDRVMKFSRLPDCATGLHSRIKDDTRIYLVSNSPMDTNWASDLHLSGGHDGFQHVLLWHMKPQDVATELCNRDFQLFRNIQSSEYVNHIFNKNSENCQTTNLTKFSKLVNEEMFWVVTEVCSEVILENRVKLLQFFLKVAQHCLEMNNFNSTFAILSGMGHNSISKLKQTWKRVPTKYMKLFESLQDLLDPSNNMSKYRSLLGIKLVQSPAIPFFPIVMKDLTFIDLGNKTFVDGMINYEKMRMIAKQVSSVTNMASPFYHNKSLELHASLNAESTSPPSMNISAFATIRKKKTPHIIAAQLKSEDNIGMAKRYLENLRVIQNEEELEKMSIALESQRHNSTRSRSELSPQTKTNQDPKQSASFKFGTDSPQSIQKLIGLTDKIAPYQHQQQVTSIQQGHRRRPNALSLSSYDTLMLTMRRGHDPLKQFKKGSENSGKRRDALLLSPSCHSKVKPLSVVRLSAESSSVSAPIRYTPSTISISKALFAITNQKPFSMTLRPQADKSSVSSSAEELEDLFRQPYLTSQSTPVSPCRTIQTTNSSLNGSTPKIPSPLISNDNKRLDNSINSSSLHGNSSAHSTETSMDSGRGEEREKEEDEKSTSRNHGNDEALTMKYKRKSLTRQRKETSVDGPHQEFTV